MLCTRIRLAERRFTNENAGTATGVGSNGPMAHRIGSSTMSTEGGARGTSAGGVVLRPCVLRNLAGFMDSNGEFGTPRTLFDRSKKEKEKEKPPLVIVSLDLPPGIKTLAPHDIKRDAKRIPCFSEQLKEFKRNQSYYEGPKKAMQAQSSNNDAIATCDPSLMIRGFDILNTGKDDVTENGADQQLHNNSNGDDDDDADLYDDLYFWNKPMHPESDDAMPQELQIQLTDCCQCMHDVNAMRRDNKFERLFSENSDDIPDDLLPMLNQYDAKLQQESLYQQHHGHPYMHNTSRSQHSQDTRFLTVNNAGRIEPYQAYKPPYVPFTRMLFRRTPSPRTRQVINVNVTMSSKKCK